MALTGLFIKGNNMYAIMDSAVTAILLLAVFIEIAALWRKVDQMEDNIDDNT